jgi:hypothetical protein
MSYHNFSRYSTYFSTVAKVNTLLAKKRKKDKGKGNRAQISLQKKETKFMHFSLTFLSH